MNLASALFKQVLELSDFDTWVNVRKHYLPNEYHQLFDIINKHSDKYHKLPTLEELKLEVRDAATVDKVYALETVEVDVEPSQLLDYLKTEYAQKEALFQLDKWIDQSVAFETAEEVVRHIQQIGIELEEKVELTPPEENMQKISLFDSEEEMGSRIKLGLNNDFDAEFDFRASDYILFGGKRGAGKSIVVVNVANNVVEEQKKTALIFSIEMEPREVLQRSCAVATGVPFRLIRDKDMGISDWEKVIRWQASRYIDGEEDVEAWLKHHDYNRFHSSLSRRPLSDAIVDIVYDPNLTLGRIRAETDKRMRKGKLGLVAVDYINKVKRIASIGGINHYDWKEQMAISHELKQQAQETRVPHLSPYQIDKDGEARMAKGILDSCDAALTLEAHKNGITFTTTKMRGARDDAEFTSGVTWPNLRIGPNSVEKPEEPSKPKKDKPGSKLKEGIYDDDHSTAPF